MQTRFNLRKTAQAAALLLKLRGGRMSYLKLIKLLYLLDRSALERWPGEWRWGADKFRIKIWDGASGGMVYDKQLCASEPMRLACWTGRKPTSRWTR